MKPQYIELAVKALAKIKEAGVAVTINRYAPTTVIETGTPTKGAPTIVATSWVVFLPASNGKGASQQGTIDPFDNRSENGALIDSKIRFVKLPAYGLTLEPIKGDEFVVAGAKWEVLGATPIAPDGEPILFNVGLIRL
jgi:hypothetical protein